MPDESKLQSTTQILQASSMPEFDIKENWNLWHERLELHFLEIGCTVVAKKISVLLKAIGSEAYEILHSICSPTLPSAKTYDELCKLMKQHFTPSVIIFHERKNFYSAKKSDGESVAQWYARVKKLSLNCSFGTSLDNIIMDKFIVELPVKIFEKLCEEDETLTSVEAFKKAKLRESKLMQGTSTCTSNFEVSFVKQRGKAKTNISNGTKGTYGKPKKPCMHCGWKNHTSNSCKYKNSKCHQCGVVGHLKNICRNKVHFIDNNVKFINENSGHFEKYSNNFFDSIYSITAVDEQDEFDYSVYAVNEKNEQTNRSNHYELPVFVNGVRLSTQCDTGAPCSLMSVNIFDQFFDRSSLQLCSTPFTGYGGDLIDILGEFKVCVNFDGQNVLGKFVVTKTNRPTLLGRDFLRSFGFELLQRPHIQSKSHSTVNFVNSYNEIINQIKNEFAEVFSSSLGKYNISKVSLPISSEAVPIFCKPRPVPLAWRDTVEKQLNELVQKGMLIPVDNADWGTPLVIIPKPNGELRICGDYKVTINRFLIDYKYPLPRIDQIFASMQGGIVFTKLDMSSAYNQLVLDDEAQNLCTWSTHKGTFRMTRLPFGVKPAAAIFQKTVENLLREFSNVFCYQDDIVVTGTNFSDHLKTLKQVLFKILTAGFKLNIKKCEFFKEKISYLGFDITKDGLTKNKDRIKSVLNAPRPQDISELRAFIGMVNHHSKFIENFAQKMSSLYKLLQKDVEFKWTKECHIAFELMKTEICSDKVLVHFNPDLPIILSTDACNTALAGVLSNRYNEGKRPIAYVSRALNSAERNYSTIEKEALAIVFSVIKLKQYLLGMHFILQTDHRPLITIFGENKGIPIMAAARMQRWAFILSGFNYTIEYIKGSLNDADSLSRIGQYETADTRYESNYINYVGFTNVLQLNFSTVAKFSRQDPILSKVMDCINNGTVEQLKGDEFKSFRLKSNELTVESGCILWGYRTVIPKKLQQNVLNELHLSHFGVVKTKALARSYVYWPNLDKDIENLIKRCESCQLARPSPEKSELIPWKPTDSAWKRIHIDYAGPVHGFYLLIVVDSYSKWIEVFKTKQMTTSFTISKLRETFSRYGLIDTLVSDNGTQFTSYEFKEFVKENGIKFILIAPGNPSSNGQAENTVKTVKKSLIASLRQNKPSNFEVVLGRFLFDYRITKHCTTNETPAKLMLNKELKTRFSLLRPPLTKEIIETKQQVAIKNFKGKRSVDFNEGQKVLVRNYKNPNKAGWSKAIIKKKIGPRNYTCLLIHDNRDIKRHTNQIIDNETVKVVELSKEDSLTEVENEQAPDLVERDDVSDINVDSSDDADAFMDANESIPDVVERPAKRDSAKRAKEKITKQYKGHSNRNNRRR
ncbi:uncharacterized protein K02A2.6-like [Contarinia nasturtii]|uniref:uncharacterized protein K02A2.6-like n=1 Tax=Contarinia nasturtii TaxID=265458 RepID=UPI0012D48897|nr:uncharacterized protein K02A2.6-like [Contarinia nasturtii]